jgi:hypothetical protein
MKKIKEGGGGFLFNKVSKKKYIQGVLQKHSFLMIPRLFNDSPLSIDNYNTFSDILDTSYHTSIDKP